jgi:hypothetical protein
VIVRWGLETLLEACAEAGVAAPLVIASPRWEELELPLEERDRWRGMAETVARQLTDQREQQPPEPQSWWQWLRSTA